MLKLLSPLRFGVWDALHLLRSRRKDKYVWSLTAFIGWQLPTMAIAHRIWNFPRPFSPVHSDGNTLYVVECLKFWTQMQHSHRYEFSYYNRSAAQAKRFEIVLLVFLPHISTRKYVHRRQNVKCVFRPLVDVECIIYYKIIRITVVAPHPHFRKCGSTAGHYI